jgi:hypothetical protein
MAAGNGPDTTRPDESHRQPAARPEPADPAHPALARAPGRSPALRRALRLISLLLLLGAAGLAWQEWNRFQAARSVYPPGSTAAGVPVGGLDREAAVQRLQAVYTQPLELRYAGERIWLDPQAAGFQLDFEKMLPPENPASWPVFRAFLEGAAGTLLNTPLEYSLEHSKLQQALEDLAARYDRSPTAPLPYPASVNYRPGSPGRALDLAAAESLVTAALPELDRRTVELPVRELPPPPPLLQNLEILFEQIIAASGLDAVADLFLHDLQTGEDIHFALRGGQRLDVEPDLAFTASSIIKIPILLSVFRRLETEPDELTSGWLTAMFARSSNEASDAAMRYAIDEVRGPLVVSEDLQELGLENTFLAGYFAPGSPLLQIYETPANRRTDVATHPDLYNQATPSEIGALLAWIYACAQAGEGPLLETFPGEITQAECTAMVEYMKLDREPYMLKALLPEGTPAARKHGYGSTAAGVINTIGDAGIFYTPGGDYVLVIFLNNPDLLLFDPANEIMAKLSLAAYNYFNVR